MTGAESLRNTEGSRIKDSTSLAFGCFWCRDDLGLAMGLAQPDGDEGL